MPTPLLVQGTAARLPLADRSVSTIVTSPPYWGLRVYTGLAPTPWLGGSFAELPGAAPTLMPGPTTWEALEACAHVWQSRETRTPHTGNGRGKSTLKGRNVPSLVMLSQMDNLPSTDVTCERCGCWCGTLGNEPTMAHYVWHLVLVLRECHRVLRDDGVCWWNLGDAYASGGRQSHGTRVGDKQRTTRGMNGSADPPRVPQPEGVPDGSLLLLPARVALAAQAEGWIVRSQVVWEKKSCLPESVAGWRHEQARCACVTYARGAQPSTHAAAHLSIPQRSHGEYYTPPTADPTCSTCQGRGHTEDVVLRRGSWRHTRATEDIFMLCKSMSYWANGEAVREPHKEASIARVARTHHTQGHKWESGPGRQTLANDLSHALSPGGRNPRNVLHEPYTAEAALTALRQWLATQAPEVLAAYEDAQQAPTTLVTPAPSSFAGAHFATFSPSLIAPLIQAACPERICVICHQPWAPVVMSQVHLESMLPRSRSPKGLDRSDGRGAYPRASVSRTVLDLRRTCPCPADTPWTPGVVLDPFAGSATTLLVARTLGRMSLGVEASPTYLVLARERLGFADLDAWRGEAPLPQDDVFTDLPLFAAAPLQES